jgi:hypothetical protein
VATAALAVAVVGLVLAALSLGWQLASFFLAGPRVRVHIREGFRGADSVLVGPPSTYTEKGLRDFEARGYEAVLGIEATNLGRLPASVVSVRFEIGNDQAAYIPAPGEPMNPQLPHRLDSHSVAAWWAPREEVENIVRNLVKQSSQTGHVRAHVHLANKEVASRNTLDVRDG